MSNVGKIMNKRTQDHAKPYDRPQTSLFRRVGSKIRSALMPITPSFLVPHEHALPSKSSTHCIPESAQSSQLSSSEQIQVEAEGYVATFDCSVGSPGTGGCMPSIIYGNDAQQPGYVLAVGNSMSGSGQFISKGSYSHSQQHTTTLSAENSPPRYEDATRGNNTKRMRLDAGIQAVPYSSALASNTTGCFGNRRSVDSSSFLWSSSKTSASTGHNDSTVVSSKPGFSVAAFQLSNTKVRDEVSVLSNSYKESPFYRGRTTFGGAASQKQPSASPYQLVSGMRQQVRVKGAAVSDSASGVSSSTAKRILDVLQQNESLNEQSHARSFNSSLLDSPLSFSAALYARASVKAGPPVKSLLTPTENIITRSRSAFTVNKQTTSFQAATSQCDRETDLFAHVRSCAASGGASSLSVAATSGISGNAGGGGGKMKRDHSKHYTSSRAHGDTNEEPLYQLPTNITLPLLKGFSPVNATTTTATTAVPTATTVVTSESLFTFSKPSNNTNEQRSCTLTSSDISNYGFRIPLLLASPKSAALSTEYSASGAAASSACYSRSSLHPSTAHSVTNYSAVLPKASLADFTFNVANATKKTSSAAPLRPLSELFKSDDTWDCQECLVKNMNSASTCVACTMKKPTLKDPVSSLPSLAEVFQRPADEWKCEECYVSNKISQASCIACGTPRPGIEDISCDKQSDAGYSVGGSQSTNAAITTNFKFGSSQPDMNAGTTSATDSGFKFGTSQVANDTLTTSSESSGFKFGATPIVANAEINNVTSSSFQFGTSLSGTNTKPISAAVSGFKSATNAEMTSGFKFGVSQSTTVSEASNVSVAGGFKFGQSTGDKSSESTSTASNVVKFGGSLSVTNAETATGCGAGGFNFGAPRSAANAETNTGGFKFGPSQVDSNVNTSSIDSSGGFKFGAAQHTTHSNACSSSVNGGFVFGASQPVAVAKTSSSTTTGGFKFGASHAAASTVTTGVTAGGFKFDSASGTRNSETLLKGVEGAVQSSVVSSVSDVPTCSVLPSYAPQLSSVSSLVAPTSLAPTSASVFNIGMPPAHVSASAMPASLGQLPISGAGTDMATTKAPTFDAFTTTPGTGYGAMQVGLSGMTATSTSGSSVLGSASATISQAPGIFATISQPSSSQFTFGSSGATTTGRGLGAPAPSLQFCQTNSKPSTTTAALGFASASLQTTPVFAVTGSATSMSAITTTAPTVPLFGQTNTFGVFSVPTSTIPSAFGSTGAALSSFGQTTSAAPFVFGQSSAPIPFGQSSVPAFGAVVTTAAAPFTGFGSSPAFGASQTQPSGVFGFGAAAPMAPATQFSFSQSAAPAVGSFNLGKRSAAADQDEHLKRKTTTAGTFGATGSSNVAFGGVSQSTVTFGTMPQPAGANTFPVPNSSNLFIPPPNPGSVFAFGAAQQPAASNPFNPPTIAPAVSNVHSFSLTPNFQFGQQPLGQQPTSLYQFSDQTQSAQPAGAGAASSTRIIRKATRRLPRT